MNDSTTKRDGTLAVLKSDLPASIVVFLVALPLCMGIAIASGVPVAAGLITGIVGGLVVGTLAGCPLQVSGPAAGLTVIVYDVVRRFDLDMLGLIVLMAGAIQIAAGLMKLGQWFRAVSPAVIKGMLSGIGVLIFASQFHVMVDDNPKGSGLQNLVTIPQAVAKAIRRPEVGDLETRRRRTAALRAIGELRRRQVALQERLLETIPHHDERTQAADFEGREPIADADLRSVLPIQEAITADLENEVETIKQFAHETIDGERGQRILSSAQDSAQQSRFALDALRDGDVQHVLERQGEALSALSQLLDEMKNHVFAAHLGLLTIGVILIWQGLVPRRFRSVPAPLVAVVVATTGAVLLALPVLYVEVPDNLWDEIHVPTQTVLRDAPWGELLKAAVLIAVIASAETLLCATAVDQMQQGPRTKYDRELTAQGVGNVICGFVGALPMTGVIVRSTANIQAGGRTRLSAVLHGLWLLIFVAALAFLLRFIPTSSLAGILVYTGYKLINVRSIPELRKYGRGEVAIYIATVAMIVATDLLTGVLVGIALSAAKLLYIFSHLHVELTVDSQQKTAVLGLAGSATFLRLPLLASELERVPGDVELHVDMEHLDYVDHACLDLLMNWASQHESSGGRLVIDWESLHARFRPERKTPPPVAPGEIANRTDKPS